MRSLRLQSAQLEDENARLRAERNASRAQLKFSEESHRLATEAAEIGTWDLDMSSDVLTWSDRTKAMFGISPSAHCSMDDYYAGIHPDDLKATAEAFAAAIDPLRRANYDVEYRTVGREDGLIRWVAAKGRGLFDEAGQCVRALGTAIDVTARKRAEVRTAALVTLGDHIRNLNDPDDLAYAAAETLGRALNISRAGYGTIDTQTETITIERDWNAPGIKSLAGVLQFRDYGSYIEDLKRGETVVFADAKKDPRTAATADALKGINAVSLINMPVREQGGLVALLYLNNDTAREWSADEISLVREIAERTRTAIARLEAEQELRELALSLEAQVEERTAAYQEAAEQLRQSQKMEAVGQLTGGLAHDFNNLLAVVTGSLELLERRITQGRVNDIERFLSAAQNATKRAAALTHRLLAFSRRQTLDPKPVGINQLIADMDDLVRRTVGPEIAVETVGAAGLWTALVDPNQLENALLNLCINARDAMPDGGRLTIETANRWLDTREARKRGIPAGQYVSLSVSDTGSGMPPEVVAKAFDPFFTTKPLGQGTGLGLSMIYGFAQQSGGQVRIYSEVGHGTVVSIYLPRHLGEAVVDRTMAFATPSRASQGDTVLIVDDEPGVRMLVIEVLEELGYSAIEATDGPTALRIMQSNVRIDLLVTDVGLPGGLNGRQVADAGRVERPDLKVLFITGYAENAVVGNGHLDHGMAILTKPFAVDILSSRVKELIAS